MNCHEIFKQITLVGTRSNRQILTVIGIRCKEKDHHIVVLFYCVVLLYIICLSVLLPCLANKRVHNTCYCSWERNYEKSKYGQLLISAFEVFYKNHIIWPGIWTVPDCSAVNTSIKRIM